MAKSEWDLGQTLMERGFCTLDQVREALSIQDRMKQMGIVPKPLEQVLLEKGYVNRSQLAQAGVVLPPPVSSPPPPRVPARVSRSRPAPRAWGPLLALGGGVGLLVLVVAFGSDILKVFTSGPAKKGPSDSSDPGAAEEEKADQKAKEELALLEGFQATAPNFENADEVARRYQAYLKTYAGRKWELEAHARLEAYRARAEAFARPELEAILKREGPLRDQERYLELLRLFRSFPPKYLSITPSGRLVQEKVSGLVQKMQEAYLQGKVQIDTLVQAKKFDEALEALRRLESIAPEERLKELPQLRDRIEGENYSATSKLKRDLRDQYLRIDGAFKGALQRRDAKRAAGVICDFLFVERAPEESALLRQRGVDYAALSAAIADWKPEKVVAACEAVLPDPRSPDLLSTSEAALLDLRSAGLVGMLLRDAAAVQELLLRSGEAVTLPSRGPGRFVRREEKILFVPENQRAQDGALKSLVEEDVVFLANRATTPGSRDARAGFFYYYAANDLEKKALLHLAKAREEGVKGIQVFMGTLLAAVQTQEARELRTKFGAAQSCLDDRQWSAAKKLLDEILESPEHPFTQAMKPEIERMRFQAIATLDLERQKSALYKGKAELQPDGRLLVRYDFQEKSQLDAFELVLEEEKHKFKGRWKIEPGAIESSRETSVLRWRTPVKGDISVEYDLTPLDDPQNIVLDLYYQKGHSQHYAVVLGFDWIGKAEGDPDNTAEDRFGMPRTCVIKYPVNVDKSRWVLPAQWENWISRLVGHAPGPAWKPAKGKTVRLQVDRLGKKIRLSADGTAVWEGEDDAYSEGQLVFFSDSRCRIANLKITLKP
jgi:hypothetical protein